MNPDKVNIIYGPPGTGKTTELLRIVELLLDDGFPSQQIGFIAFTRKAANEAKSRAMSKFGLNAELLPWFRTIHSLAFNQLGLSKNDVLSIRNYFELANILGVSISVQGKLDEGTIAGLSKGDRMFFMENMSRALKMTLREYWESIPNEDIYFYELERVQAVLNTYKEQNQKYDFTDIIKQFILNGVSPDIKVLIVDEAQDLTPLQWDGIEVIGKDVEEIYIAGDDDQAIFRWAGADVDKFINLQGNRRTLDKSYRIPLEVQGLATDVVSRIKNRVNKVWAPREAQGAVEYATSIDQIDMSAGTWLLLGRNTYLLDQYVQHCTREGFVFDSQTGSPVKGKSFSAIKHWEELRKGESVAHEHVVEIYEHMTTKVGIAYGFKKQLERADVKKKYDMKTLRETLGLLTEDPWDRALDKLTEVEREYFLVALRRGEKLLQDPRIKISTIHGAKGGEAENVVVCTDMADRTFNEYQENPDDEHRVWYVAITRAKEKLYIIQPTSNRSYNL
jgi:DNA helicase-2/ATP-dependent DNA helicase PcrA